MIFFTKLVSVCYAFINEWFPYTTFGMIGGFGVACLVAVPDWGWFNKDPVGWHKAIDPEKEAKHFEKIQKKKNKKAQKEKKTKTESGKEKKTKKDK